MVHHRASPFCHSQNIFRKLSFKLFACFACGYSVFNLHLRSPMASFSLSSHTLSSESRSGYLEKQSGLDFLSPRYPPDNISIRYISRHEVLSALPFQLRISLPLLPSRFLSSRGFAAFIFRNKAFKRPFFTSALPGFWHIPLSPRYL